MHDIIYLLGDKKMKLLIVDDEELIRNVIKEYASLEGFEIDEAYDGLNAIDMVKNNDYDLLTTTSDQVYLTREEMKEKWQENYQKYYDKISKAVKETSNLVIKYNNEIIVAYYFAMSNGYTEDAQNVFNEQNYIYMQLLARWIYEKYDKFIEKKSI